jgi:hypothetical protein
LHRGIAYGDKGVYPVLLFRAHSRRQRYTVWVMLLAWMLALTAAVINACALNIPGAARRGSLAESHAAHSSRAVVVTEHHDGWLLTHHKHEQSGVHDSCVKFCDDESSALSKAKASTALDPGAAMVATVQPVRAVVPSASIGTGPARRQPTAQGPPLVIRFLRLTL